MSHVRRLALPLALAVLLAAPATALPLKGSAPEAFPVLSFFQGLWERVTEPVLSLLDVRSTFDEQRGIWDPSGEPLSDTSLAFEPQDDGF